MKFLKPLLIFVIVFICSCKSETKTTINTSQPEPTVLEKIANAHGFENWKNVNQIKFTFNVDRDSTHFERTWIWKTNRNEITRISGNDTLQYNRSTMDSIAIKTNAGFVNDRYWLLAPFNLIWDADNFEHTLAKNDTAPIANKPSQKLTIVYGNEGGYTPGDAYDFYFNEDYIIREWVFRKSNQKEPSMITTWENHQDFNGILIALDHKKKKGAFNLFFDDIKVQLNQ